METGIKECELIILTTFDSSLFNPNDDLEMLEAVDIPILIANNNREVTSDLENKQWQTTQLSGLAGWVEAINTVCEEYYS